VAKLGLRREHDSFHHCEGAAAVDRASKCSKRFIQELGAATRRASKEQLNGTHKHALLLQPTRAGWQSRGRHGSCTAASRLPTCKSLNCSVTRLYSSVSRPFSSWCLLVAAVYLHQVSQGWRWRFLYALRMPRQLRGWLLRAALVPEKPAVLHLRRWQGDAMSGIWRTILHTATVARPSLMCGELAFSEVPALTSV
jgi:hypothetical protein